jgi:hypothetical protein
VDEHERGEERPSIVFWLVVGLAGLYLGLRLIQGVIWVAQQIG